MGRSLLNSGGSDGARGPWSRHGRRGALATYPWSTDCAKSVSGDLGTARSTRDEPVNCRILARKLISIVRQPVLIAASRCYLIQMLRSALTCTNGCSCWSSNEGNRPRVFLTMDALYRLSLGRASYRFCSSTPIFQCTKQKETQTSSMHQHPAPMMIPDRCGTVPPHAPGTTRVR